jgi:hypothetical protein
LTDVFGPTFSRRCFAIVVIVFTSAAFSSVARGQGKNEFGLWGGYSFGNAHMIGITNDRQLGVLALRYGRTLFDKHAISMAYTVDIVPVEVMHQPSYVSCTTNTTAFPVGFCETGHETVYGGGIDPLGLKFNFMRQRRFQLFAGSTAGFVTSVRPIPADVPRGTRFNFDFDFQAGGQLFNSSRDRAWTFGYKLQHISNAYRSSFNPGVDLNSFFVGYSFFR